MDKASTNLSQEVAKNFELMVTHMHSISQGQFTAYAKEDKFAVEHDASAKTQNVADVRVKGIDLNIT